MYHIPYKPVAVSVLNKEQVVFNEAVALKGEGGVLNVKLNVIYEKLCIISYINYLQLQSKGRSSVRFDCCRGVGDWRKVNKFCVQRTHFQNLW